MIVECSSSCAFAGPVVECGCRWIEMDLISHSSGCITATVSAAAGIAVLSGLYSLLVLSSWLCRSLAVEFGSQDDWMIGGQHCNCPRPLASQGHVSCNPVVDFDSLSLY